MFLEQPIALLRGSYPHLPPAPHPQIRLVLVFYLRQLRQPLRAPNIGACQGIVFIVGSSLLVLLINIFSAAEQYRGPYELRERVG